MRTGARRIRLPIAIAAAVAIAYAGFATIAQAGVEHINSRVTISIAVPLYHGKVKSPEDKCKRGRRVVLFEVQPGKDHRVGRDRTNERGRWVVKVPSSQLQPQDRFYAKVRRKIQIVSGNGFVCRADRSRTVTFVGD